MASESGDLWGIKSNSGRSSLKRPETRDKPQIPGMPSVSGMPSMPNSWGMPDASGALTQTLMAFDRPGRELSGPELIALACLVNVMGVIEWLQVQSPGLARRLRPVVAPDAQAIVSSLAGDRRDDGAAENVPATEPRSLGGLDLNRVAGILNMLGLGDGGEAKEGGGGDGKLNLASLMPLLSLLLSEQDKKRKEPARASSEGQAPSSATAPAASRDEQAGRGWTAQPSHPGYGHMDYRVTEKRPKLRRDA